MSATDFFQEGFTEKKSDIMRYPLRVRVCEYRQSDCFVIDRPTHVARARTLSYRAKEGIHIAVARVKKGDFERKNNNGNRKGNCVNASYSPN